MKSFIVTFTSTETLYDEEKQRRQNTMTVRAKDEEGAKSKVKETLLETGKHNQIVIHSAQVDKFAKPKMPRPLLIVIVIAFAMLIFTYCSS